MYLLNNQVRKVWNSIHGKFHSVTKHSLYIQSSDAKMIRAGVAQRRGAAVWTSARVRLRRAGPARGCFEREMPQGTIASLFVRWQPFSSLIHVFLSFLLRVCQDCRAYLGRQVTLAGRCSDQYPLKTTKKSSGFCFTSS